MNDSNNAAERVAAELALVRLQRERRDICDRLQFAEEIVRSEPSLRLGDILPEAGVEAARRRLPSLRAAYEGSVIPKVGSIVMVALLAIILMAVITADGLESKSVAALNWGVTSVIIFFVVMPVTAFVDSQRRDSARESIATIEETIARHEAAVRLRDRIAIHREILRGDGGNLSRVDSDIARNLRIVRTPS